MAQVTGRFFVSVDGMRLRTKPGATLDTGGVTRTAVLSDSGVDGYTEATKQPSLTCTISHTADISLADLAAITNSSLRVQTDSGALYTLSQAWCAETPTLTSAGEVSLTFNAVECIEG